MKSVKRKDLEIFLNKTLNIWEFNDYGPNGLQIEGTKEIKKVAFAVSATRASVEKTIEWGADALIVHHGLFWKFHVAKTITKAFAKRVIPLIKNDVNLFGYHLPLDAHIEYGNAASIAKQIGLVDLEPFGDHKGSPTGVKGKFSAKINAADLKQKLEGILCHDVILACENDSEPMRSMGIITGGANSDWVNAYRENLDAYLTGEISEHDWHESQESGVTFFAGGHNATEQFGVQSLQKLIENEFGLETKYFSSENPA